MPSRWWCRRLHIYYQYLYRQVPKKTCIILSLKTYCSIEASLFKTSQLKQMVQHTHTHRSLIASAGHIYLSTTHTPLSRQTQRHAAHNRARGFLYFFDTPNESGERSRREETNKRTRDKVREESEQDSSELSIKKRWRLCENPAPSLLWHFTHQYTPQSFQTVCKRLPGCAFPIPVFLPSRQRLTR